MENTCKNGLRRQEERKVHMLRGMSTCHLSTLHRKISDSKLEYIADIWEVGWLGYLVRGQEGETLEDKKHEVGSKRLKHRGWAENENLGVTCKIK